MRRRVAVIFVVLMVFPLQLQLPWLNRLSIARVPGDVRFTLLDTPLCLRFGSTLLVSACAFLCAERSACLP